MEGNNTLPHRTYLGPFVQNQKVMIFEKHQGGGQSHDSLLI